MKKFGFLFLILFFIFFTTTSYSNTKSVVKKIIEIGKKDNQTMKHLDTLTNRFGGRPIGSNAYDNAAEWAGRMFKKWGMKVIFDEAGTLPVGFNRGAWFGKMTSPHSMNLHFATPSYSAGTQGKQVAHAVLEPTTDRAFERMAKVLKGAWVLLEPPKIEKPPSNLSRDERRAFYKEKREELNQRMIRLKKTGIAGIIRSAKIPINATYNRDLFKWKSWEDLPTVCDILLNEHQFEKIKQLVTERQRVELEFDIRNYFRMGPVKYHNVIGVIKGTKYPNEYVIMGGHLDSFDVASGAVDCGTGVAPTMEAARLIMKAGGKPKRTILACLWAGEEFGILGAGHWVKKYKSWLPNISNMFNRDGGPTVPMSISVSEAMWKDMEKICKPLNSINPDFPFKMEKRKPRRKSRGPGGTDSSVFSMNGVPTMGFRTGDPKGYDFKYREIWHTENDYYQKSIPEYMDHTSIVTAAVVYGIANLNHLLDRKDYYLPDEKKKPSKKKPSKK